MQIFIFISFTNIFVMIDKLIFLFIYKKKFKFKFQNPPFNKNIFQKIETLIFSNFNSNYCQIINEIYFIETDIIEISIFKKISLQCLNKLTSSRPK
jgi:hypothetical protein